MNNTPHSSETPAARAVTSARTLALTDLRFFYRQHVVIDGLSCSLTGGELVAIVGPNGCGKSTLLKLIIGALPLHRGTVAVDGSPASSLGRIGLARRMALVPQMAGVEGALGSGGAEGGFTVQQTVLMSRYAAHVDDSRGLLRAMGGLGIFGFETEHDLTLAREAMWIADVHHLAERTADSLSGGERQRVAIARALAQQTPMLLLDEPTSALDLFHQLELIAHLRSLVAADRLVMLVTHDLNLAAEIATRVLVMDQGKILADGPPKNVLTPAVLEPVYHVRVTQEAGHLRFERRKT